MLHFPADPECKRQLSRAQGRILSPATVDSAPPRVAHAAGVLTPDDRTRLGVYGVRAIRQRHQQIAVEIRACLTRRADPGAIPLRLAARHQEEPLFALRRTVCGTSRTSAVFVRADPHADL